MQINCSLKISLPSNCKKSVSGLVFANPRFMKNLYDDAFLYDLVHGEFADAETFDFYHRQIALYGSPVLELACGSGQILIPLAEKKIEIFGLDVSGAMLGACRRKALKRNVKVEIQSGDMRSFELKRKFKTILIAGNSLPHLTGNRDVFACLDCVKRHLAPGGKFIVEILNPFVPLLSREPGKKFMVGEFGEFVLTEDADYSAATRIIHKNWHFWHRPSDKITTISFSQRQFFPRECDALFQYKGFRIDKKFGDFDESAFSGDSPKQIFVMSLA